MSFQAKLYGGIAIASLVGLYAGIKSSFFIVDAGQKAIKFSRLTGLGKKVYKEGWHLRIPYFEWPIKYDCKTHQR